MTDAVTIPLLLGPRHGEQVKLIPPLPQKLRFPAYQSATPVEMTVEEYQATPPQIQATYHIYVLKMRELSDTQTALSYFWEGTES